LRVNGSADEDPAHRSFNLNHNGDHLDIRAEWGKNGANQHEISFEKALK